MALRGEGEVVAHRLDAFVVVASGHREGPQEQGLDVARLVLEHRGRLLTDKVGTPERQRLCREGQTRLGVVGVVGHLRAELLEAPLRRLRAAVIGSGPLGHLATGWLLIGRGRVRAGDQAVLVTVARVGLQRQDHHHPHADENDGPPGSSRETDPSCEHEDDDDARYPDEQGHDPNEPPAPARGWVEQDPVAVAIDEVLSDLLVALPIGDLVIDDLAHAAGHRGGGVLHREPLARGAAKRRGHGVGALGGGRRAAVRGADEADRRDDEQGQRQGGAHQPSRRGTTVLVTHCAVTSPTSRSSTRPSESMTQVSGTPEVAQVTAICPFSSRMLGYVFPPSSSRKARALSVSSWVLMPRTVSPRSSRVSAASVSTGYSSR